MAGRNGAGDEAFEEVEAQPTATVLAAGLVHEVAARGQYDSKDVAAAVLALGRLASAIRSETDKRNEARWFPGLERAQVGCLMGSESTTPLSEEPGGVTQPSAAPTPKLLPAPLSRRWGRGKWFILFIAALLLGWLASAYLLLPVWWRSSARRHPALRDLPGITYTANDIPGDPINVALIGTEEQLIHAMLAAQWDPADPLTLKSSLKIAADTVFRRPDLNAPVSSLYLFGRKQDLAFEQQLGHDPRHRHHVRFWKSDKADEDGRPVWVGSVTYDKGVGFSYTTWQITHHIAADVDAERDRLMKELKESGRRTESYDVTDFHKKCEGRNGGGDRWYTDGKLYVGVIGGQ